MNGRLTLGKKTRISQLILYFVQPTERIAIYNDVGTRWCVKPVYIQQFFALQGLKDQITADPSLPAQPAYKLTKRESAEGANI
jgi:hypothetical protein